MSRFTFGFAAILICALVAATRGQQNEAAVANSVVGPTAKDKHKVRVAGIVAKWVRGDKEANYRRVEALIRQAAANGAQIVCTTECFLDGYAIADKSIPLETYRALGEPIPGGLYFRKLAALAAELRIYLVAGMTEADGELRYNTAVLIGPDGKLLGKYHKQELEHESVRNTPGNSPGVFDTEFGKVGLMICADRRNDQLVKRLRDGGAELLLCPSGGMFGPTRNDPILQARSRENKTPIVFVHPAEFLVTGPDGSILTTKLLGDVLLVRPDEVGGQKDSQSVVYFDLPRTSPGATPSASSHLTAARSEIAKLDAFFQPPPEYANDLGKFRSPLEFYDGRPVKSAEDWPARRREILDRWHKILGPWPPLVPKPTVEVLAEERRDNFTQHHVRVQIAPDLFSEDAYLLKPDGAGPFPAVVVVYYDALTGIGRGKSPLRDYASELARRGFVALSLGSAPRTFYPNEENAQLQPLSFHAYVAANCWQLLANRPEVDAQRIGIVGHSYGGKWAMFASCLFDRFACAAWSDGGIVFDETRGNVNYWEPWYLGHEPGQPTRKPGIPRGDNPRTGPYKRLVEEGLDLHELHALMAPRPFLVSGGAEDTPERWRALNHAIAVNKLLGHVNRVAMTNRPGHSPTPESNEQIYLFFERYLK